MGDEALSVLIVDDDQGMVATLRDILEISGCDVEAAFDGSEAIEMARHQRPDCVLMDIRMPVMNGVEAFRGIKRASPHSKVVFMTAYSESHLADDARAMGAVEVLPKPLDLERLLELIREIAKRRHRSTDL